MARIWFTCSPRLALDFTASLDGLELLLREVVRPLRHIDDRVGVLRRLLRGLGDLEAVVEVSLMAAACSEAIAACLLTLPRISFAPASRAAVECGAGRACRGARWSSPGLAASSATSRVESEVTSTVRSPAGIVAAASRSRSSGRRAGPRSEPADRGERRGAERREHGGEEVGPERVGVEAQERDELDRGRDEAAPSAIAAIFSASSPGRWAVHPCRESYQRSCQASHHAATGRRAV